ncbi:MAG: Rieske 2Fe-2S domain-containing protein [Rhodocyclaceae bacterium]|nr:Rieske 2Fe-2S domain-containing protein [Rhodocyclaceae bacterium]
MAALDDVPMNGNKAFKINGRSILLCKSDAGVFALENRCSHMFAELEGGRVRGAYLFCPKHSVRFDMRTGASGGTLTKVPLQTFAVTVAADGNIEIDWPE